MRSQQEVAQTHSHTYSRTYKVNAKTWLAYKNVDADDAALRSLRFFEIHFFFRFSSNQLETCAFSFFFFHYF